jgi:2-methylisocitrate lyase-like PEP mutase family enzyme
MDIADLARAFLALHEPGNPAIVPTVWDPWSAQLAAEQGFAALTVGSAPAAAAVGRADGEDLSLTEMLDRVRLVVDAVDVPVSADLESGYGASADEIVDGLLDAGAVGLNIEDTVHSDGGRLRSDHEHADVIAAIRAAADASEVPVVVNGRTDILLRADGPEQGRVDRAIARLALAAEAGADVLYPVGILADDVVLRLTGRLPRPVNVLGRPSVDSREHLAGLGVGRVSFGPYLQRDLAAEAGRILARWR